MQPYDERPELIRSTLVVALVALGWIYLRVVVFEVALLPLTFVLPLLVGVWSRRIWHVWTMVGVFVAAAIGKVIWILPAHGFDATAQSIYFGGTLFNIIVGAIVVQLIINMRSRVSANLARISKQNAELEAQAEELSQQNEEIKVQAEELAQQNEEIESQAEELTGQNEELQEANERLVHREEILQGILESTRTPGSSRDALAELCRRALKTIGKPVERIAILRRDGSGFRINFQAAVDSVQAMPEFWPASGSIAGLVVEQDRTAYVSDLRKEPAVTAPFGESHHVHSILATPLRVSAKPSGVIAACSSAVSHWTQEQFRVIEWLAAQCGLMVEAIQWQEELANRAREIEEANRAKDQFLAMLSHELRTPLTPVLAAAGELEQDIRLPEDAREDLRMIRRNATIQSRLIDDLLDLTKLERGKLILDREILNVAKLINEAATIVAADLQAKGQQLSLDLAAAEGCVVIGDGARLQQVFWNLLKNAVKFSPTEASIRVKARVTRDPVPAVVIEVIDSGVGLVAENLDRIFRPFEQVLGGGKQRSGDTGLGLGLAIAKAIVDLHHGRIRAASHGIGCGATFTVELPLATAAERQAGSAPPRAVPRPGADGKPHQILLVEDHGDTGRVIARLLKNAGYLVDHSETAAGAQQLASTKRFDLVISDLGLPDASGLSLMPELRAAQPWLRGICLSGYGMEDDLQACRAAGFTEHLTKPVDLQRLHAAIGRVLSPGMD